VDGQADVGKAQEFAQFATEVSAAAKTAAAAMIAVMSRRLPRRMASALSAVYNGTLCLRTERASYGVPSTAGSLIGT